MSQGVFGEFRTTFRTIPRLREAGIDVRQIGTDEDIVRLTFSP